MTLDHLEQIVVVFRVGPGVNVVVGRALDFLVVVLCDGLTCAWNFCGQEENMYKFSEYNMFYFRNGTICAGN